MDHKHMKRWSTLLVTRKIQLKMTDVIRMARSKKDNTSGYDDVE